MKSILVTSVSHSPGPGTGERTLPEESDATESRWLSSAVELLIAPPSYTRNRAERQKDSVVSSVKKTGISKKVYLIHWEQKWA